MSNKKNKIENILKELDTEGNTKNSIYEGLKTGAISLAGAGVGRVCGRPSLALGLATVMLGHYKGSNRLTSFGVGVMAGGGLALADSLKGPEQSTTVRVKERLKEFGNDIKHRLYLDKFMKAKGTTNGVDGTDGVENVQYFKYPGNELNMGSLNAIEDELLRATEERTNVQVTGYDDFAGIEEPIY